MTPTRSVKLSAPVDLSPETPQVDALVFAAAPDTQALSVQGAKHPSMLLDNGGVRYYEGADYLIDYDDDGYAVSITTREGGALDAGGNADATYLKAFFDADESSVWHPTSADEVRITIDCGAGASECEVTTQGRVGEDGTAYPLGSLAPVPNGSSFTRMIEEPNSQVRVTLSTVTGPVKVTVQENS